VEEIPANDAKQEALPVPRPPFGSPAFQLPSKVFRPMSVPNKMVVKTSSHEIMKGYTSSLDFDGDYSFASFGGDDSLGSRWWDDSLNMEDSKNSGFCVISVASSIADKDCFSDKESLFESPKQQRSFVTKSLEAQKRLQEDQLGSSDHTHKTVSNDGRMRRKSMRRSKSLAAAQEGALDIPPTPARRQGDSRRSSSHGSVEVVPERKSQRLSMDVPPTPVRRKGDDDLGSTLGHGAFQGRILSLGTLEDMTSSGGHSVESRRRVTRSTSMGKNKVVKNSVSPGSHHCGKIRRRAPRRSSMGRDNLLVSMYKALGSLSHRHSDEKSVVTGSPRRQTVASGSIKSDCKALAQKDGSERREPRRTVSHRECGDLTRRPNCSPPRRSERKSLRNGLPKRTKSLQLPQSLCRVPKSSNHGDSSVRTETTVTTDMSMDEQHSETKRILTLASLYGNCDLSARK